MLRETQRFAGIDDKKIIVHFHGLRKCQGHLPESPRIMTTQHKYFSNLLFETIGILVQDRYIDMQFAHWLQVQLHFDIFSHRTNNSSRYIPCQQSLYTMLHFVSFWCLHHLVFYNLELLWIISWFSKCMQLHISQVMLIFGVQVPSYFFKLNFLPW